MLTAVVVLSFALGFFAGREHLKYQMVSTFAEAAGQFAAALKLPNSDRPEPAKPEPTLPRQENKSQIDATLTSKGYRPSRPSDHEYFDYITFSITFHNKSNKAIRAFEGSMLFTDLLDKQIMSVNMTISDPLMPYSSTNWDGTLKYNQFIDSHTRLMNAEFSNIKARFVTKKILYSDGTSETFD